jgi:hypothetical protein
VIVAIIAGNVFGHVFVHSQSLGWLVPVIVLGFLLLRLSRIRR